MEQEAAARGKGARKGSAAPPARAEGPARPASAPKGPGRGQQQQQQPPSPRDPVEGAAWLGKAGEGSPQAEQGSAPSRRKAPPQKSPPQADRRDPAGKSSPPAQGRGAVRKKQARPVEAKALAEEKGAAASGGAPRPRKQGPPAQQEPHRGETGAAPPGRKAAPQEKRAPDAQEPQQKGAAAAAGGRSSLRPVLRRLRLRKAEISHNSRRVNWVRDLLVKAIAREGCFGSVAILGTGSYYEHTKITKPDEFDIMLKVPEVRLELEPYDTCDYKDPYYLVKLKRNPTLKQLNKFADQEHLSASKILSELRTIITDEVKTINEMKVTVEREKPGSPAVTLQIGEPPSRISVDIILALEMTGTTLWDSRKGGPDVKKWLGAQMERQLYRQRRCLVPKNVKVGAHFIDTWRLSFSLAEKTIIKYHGNAKTCCEDNGKKCCRKDCLKLLKYLLEQLKTKHQSRNQFNKFCSYHAKTAFFHTCAKWTSDDEWLPENFDECFERLLNYFLDCLRIVELKHFFIPEYNLFCADLKCSILAQAIESEQTNGFPIFKQT
uniref:cyclic GMP-AMP synthase n=1 Tax=Euleptes europaea TaxID=460621 RepID=UPI0025423231|nr:cyclic GMP-AMP synthase [Euleptes europaea]